jgi:hypothetical protein
VGLEVSSEKFSTIILSFYFFMSGPIIPASNPSCPGANSLAQTSQGSGAISAFSWSGASSSAPLKRLGLLLVAHRLLMAVVELQSQQLLLGLVMPKMLLRVCELFTFSVVKVEGANLFSICLVFTT